MVRNGGNQTFDFFVREQIVVNLFALFRQQLFRIIQLLVPEFFRKNNRRRYDRPGQCTAARFVDPRDGGNSERAQFAFMPESAAPIHPGENTEKLKN